MMEKLQLFLVEADDALALLIRKGLERAGHAVTRCRTAADALIVLSQGTYDLVLLSGPLPDMAGPDLLYALAREGISVPCILITAAGQAPLGATPLGAAGLR